MEVYLHMLVVGSGLLEFVDLMFRVLEERVMAQN